MDRIWWFGVKDTIPMLCNKHLSLDPDMDPEWLTNTIISTFQHGMAHGDTNCSSVVGIGIPCYSNVLYDVQNICRIMYPTSEVTLIFLQNVSLHALRAVQYYFELSNTLVLVAEYVQTNVHIDWILANHLIGLLYFLQSKWSKNVSFDFLTKHGSCLTLLINWFIGYFIKDFIGSVHNR